MSVYASPRFVDDLSNCYFYHEMDIPGFGTVEGSWKLKDRMADYLGNFNFDGKRVLDVGCASGALSFYMESQGADVVSFDMDKSGDWDLVPFVKWEYRRHIAKERKKVSDSLNNSYWLAHRMLKSNAKVVYGSVYDVPEAIGPVDVSVYGSILLHLRDPFLALQSGLNLTQETVIVEETLRGEPFIPMDEPYIGFLPDAKTTEPKDTWWDIRPEWVVRVLGVFGFEDTKVTFHKQNYEGRQLDCYTVVGNRTHSDCSVDPF